LIDHSLIRWLAETVITSNVIDPGTS